MARATPPQEDTMHISVRLRGLEAPDVVRDTIGRRARFALGRFDGQLRSVTTLVVDENGPRGGADKRCRVGLRLRDGGRLNIERTGDRVLDVVDEALDRGARALVRHLERARGERHVAVPPPGRRARAPRDAGSKREAV
jgi:putative sigma-54 modulation protein